MKILCSVLYVLFVVHVLFAVSGCSYNAAKRAGITAEQQTRISELVQGADIANMSAIEKASLADQALMVLGVSLTNSPAVSNLLATASTNLAGAQRAQLVTDNQLDRAGRITGPPVKDQTEFIRALLSTNLALVASAELENKKRTDQEQVWFAEKREYEAKLLDYGAKYEAEHNKHIWRRFWEWSIGTFGLLGGIAFIVFCPAIAFPILTRLTGWLTTAIPSLAKWLGVVKHSVVATIAQGIEDFRAKEPEAVVKLEACLGAKMDKAHKNVVKAIKAEGAKQGVLTA